MLRSAALILGLVAGGGTRALLPADEPPATLTARLADGVVVEGQLWGDSPDSLGLRDRAGRDMVPLKRIPLIQGSPIPRLIPVRGRPAQLELLENESFPVGDTKFRDDLVRLQPLGGEPVSIPRAALGMVRQPAGEMITRFLDAENAEESRSRSESWSLPVSTEHSWSGKASFAVLPGAKQTLLSTRDATREGTFALMYYDAGESRPAAVWQLDCEFDGPDGRQQLRVTPGCQGAEILIRLGTEEPQEPAVSRVQGWHSLRLLFSTDRAVLLRDEQVLASVGPNLRGLKSVNLTAVADGAADRPLAWIDDVAISRTVRPVPVPPLPAEQDSLWLAGGDELFTTLRGWDSQVVQVGGTGEGRQYSWSDIAGVALAARAGSPSPVVSGWVSEIELETRYGNIAGSSSRIVGALRTADGESLEVDHPWLGRLRLRQDWLSRIQPRYRGSLRALDLTPVHLGNDLHADWRQPRPNGTEHAWTFDHQSGSSARSAFLRLTVVDLEPLGGTFAQSGKHYAELSQGGLLTVVWLNGRPVTDLNQHLDRPASVATPRSIRIPVPLELLQNGTNTLKLVQSPSRRDPAEYDDCEVSGACLELVE